MYACLLLFLSLSYYRHIPSITQPDARYILMYALAFDFMNETFFLLFCVLKSKLPCAYRVHVYETQ